METSSIQLLFENGELRHEFEARLLQVVNEIGKDDALLHLLKQAARVCLRAICHVEVLEDTGCRQALRGLDNEESLRREAGNLLKDLATPRAVRGAIGEEEGDV